MSSGVQISSVPTMFLLLAQYGGRATIPLEQVVKDYFSHLTPAKFLQKTLRGEIPLPIIRIENSQKAPKHVALKDLAAYLDARWAAAVKERDQLCGLSE